MVNPLSKPEKEVIMAENKMEQAATMNNFDKLLGKNGELVELRKEQILAGAMRIIQQHYADKQNKMEAVAALFGKKIGEEFRVVSDNGLSCICRFDENNILEFKDMRGRWIQNHAINYVMIGELLKGRAEIVEE